jgi:hypothetical protein
MAAFESVTRDAFAAALRDAPMSSLFRKQYERLAPSDYDGWHGPDHAIHRGALVVRGDLVAPPFNTVIFDDLTVDGLLDLQNPYDKGFDEGGQFYVFGNVSCRIFAHQTGKCTMIDGSLEARELLLHDHDDSALWVIGDLVTRFFFGGGWTEVGGEAAMDYGIGVYSMCKRLGWPEVNQVFRPRHDEDASRRLLAFDDIDSLTPRDFLDRWRASKSLFD